MGFECIDTHAHWVPEALHVGVREAKPAMYNMETRTIEGIPVI